MEDHQLWDKIDSFQIDESEATLSFSRRLARENSWAMEYTERVITEYKRFIYLVVISRKELTPSDEVDQAWHLHLTYTHSYWDRLCKGIQGVELHHLPTRGGSSEQQRFRDQYAFTLERYRETFKSPPPVDIWPSVDQRFAAVESFVRVNTARRWLIPRPSPLITNMLLITTLPLLLISCSDDLSDNDFWFWLKLIFGLYVLYRVVKWLGSGGGRNSGGGSGGCGGCAGCGGCGGG
ncbi:MAG: hypothetical protein ABW096_17010 [Candidatus Thiodiazotropha sp.]